MEVLETRMCRRCSEVQPLTEFRRRRCGDKWYQFHQCRKCHNKSQRCRAQRIRQEKRHHELGLVWTQIKNTVDREEVGQMLADLFHSLGGSKGFAMAVKNWLELARKRNPSATGVMNAYLAILRLAELYGNPGAKPGEPDYGLSVDQMSDADLDQELEKYALRMLQQNPAIAIRLALQLGWTVVPPEDADL